MASFGEALRDARKNKNWTQEQLSEAVNVTRQSISNWERDRSLPDRETLERMSKLLECNLYEAAGMIPANFPSDKNGHAASNKNAAKLKRKWKIALCAAAAALVVLVLALVFPTLRGRDKGSTEARTPLGAGDVPTISMFKFKDAPAAGKPYVYVTFNEDPCPLVEDEAFAEGKGWFYTAYLTEYNGFEFTIDRYTQVLFSDENHSTSWSYDADTISSWWGDSLIAARGQRAVSGGTPLQDLAGIGIQVDGHSESGEEMSFYGFMEVETE